MKILHITTDEKFIDGASWQFETVYPGGNKFIILVSDVTAPLVYIKNVKNYVIKVCNEESIRFILNLCPQYDLICYHGLDYFRSRIILRTPSASKILWMLWGLEVHNNPSINNNISLLFGATTYRHFYKDGLPVKFFKFIKKILRVPYYRFVHNSFVPGYNIKKAIKKVNYCGILYREEYDYVKFRTNTRAAFFEFCYYPLEFVLDQTELTYVQGNDILIGNSASLTNNHLDIFKLLEDFNLGERKLIVPLNYGDFNYSKEIISIGEAKFSDNFWPLVNFMPLKEYNEILKKCGIVLMGHIRQQAVGNVLILLYMGAKVYLDKRNTLFHFLKRINIKIFSLNSDFGVDNLEVFKLLSRDEINHNRNILLGKFGRNKLITDLMQQLKKITECL